MAASDTRDRLSQTAADLFYQHGFQAVGLDQILDEVGITKTAFYKHFESKDDLIVATLKRHDHVQMEEWGRYIRMRGSDGARAQLVAVFDMLDEWFSEPSFRGCLFFNALTEFPSEHDPINQTARAYGAHLAQIVSTLAQSAGAADPAALTHQFMLLITGAIVSRHRAGDLHAAKSARAVARVLVDAHCAQPQLAPT
jgi:AcrR family transcriptional regulator